MYGLEKDVAVFFEREVHPARGSHVLAAVSGGADSVCLLRVLCNLRKALGITISVVHVEHGLRGEESLEDARFVQDLCGKLGIPCTVRGVDLSGPAGFGLTVEEAARNERYRVFEEIRCLCGADFIATAHHADDQAETVLMNLVRGSGPKGLGGILPVRGHIIRPLLGTTRAQIEEYLKNLGQSWRTDPTNLTGENTRSRMRMDILPLLKEEINAGSVRHICETAAQMREVEAFLEQQTMQIFPDCVKDTEDGRIAVFAEPLLECPPVLRTRILRRAMERMRSAEPFADVSAQKQADGERCVPQNGLKDLSREHVRMLEKLLRAPCGKRADLPGISAVREKFAVVLSRAFPGGKDTAAVPEEEREEEDCVCIVKDGRIAVQGGQVFYCGWLVKVQIRDYHGETIPRKKYTEWLDYDKIKEYVVLRKGRTGDYLTINRAGQHKLLRRYLIDEKIPAARRAEYFVAADAQQVLWVSGMRLSEHVRVTETTRRILILEMHSAEMKQQEDSMD